MWKGMYHSRWVIDRSRGKTWQHLIATIGAAMTFHGQESWIQATRMAVSLAVTLSTQKVQNRKPRLRQCCAVLRLSHSRVSEQSKLLRCWRTSHLMSHLSGRLSSIWWAVNHHLYLWTRFLACLACSHTFWCATLNLFPINLFSSHFCVIPAVWNSWHSSRSQAFYHHYTMLTTTAHANYKVTTFLPLAHKTGGG